MIQHDSNNLLIFLYLRSAIKQRLKQNEDKTEHFYCYIIFFQIIIWSNLWKLNCISSYIEIKTEVLVSYKEDSTGNILKKDLGW